MALPPPRSDAAALITGASSGIGAAIAGELCRRGHNAILVARRRDRLEDLAARLHGEHGTRVEVMVCDVAEDASRRGLIDGVRASGLDVDVAVLSAGFGMTGPYLEHDPERVLQMIRTNLESSMMLSHPLLADMVTRQRGALLLVSSMAGHQPMPGFGAYAATKAAVTSFAQMLSEEVRRDGVTVTALCPGVVYTEFADIAGAAETQSSMPAALGMSAEDCARAAVNGLDAGARIVMPRAAVRALTLFGANAPRALWLPLCRRLMRG